MIDQTIGHYRIVDRLGAGGMGEVYLAEDTTLHRKIALKVLPPELAARPERMERFEREARTLAALDHPNIVTIYSVEDADGIRFLTMAYVEGRTLAEMIPPEGLPVDRWVELGEALAEGLQAAHARGIVHRDLKPGNVMVDHTGRLRILDFGLAKLQPARGPDESERLTETASPVMTREGTILGTYPYMSPEQAEGASIDARSDLFSLGTILYEMATGRQPFTGATPAALISSILKDAPRPLTEIRPEWPAGLARIVERCLEKDPDERFQSARETRDALTDRRTSIASEEPAGRRPTGIRGQRRWIAVATAVAVIAVATLWLTGEFEGTAPGAAPTGSQAWQQITFFPDSAVSPALSPDGRMLVFLRGPSTFFGTAQVHVKLLPDGDPMPLTNDDHLKMSPVFTPDGARVAYTVVDKGPNWDTWIVPVFGGEPRPWLANASGLTWSGPGRILFSEIEQGLKMGLATARESRADTRWIYRPEHERGMVHRSALSPDGRWVLAVEMETGAWLPCRLLKYDGTDSGRAGPDGPCTHAAWSPDGTWMYFSASAGQGYHLWRQRFPDGEPEQLTAGPTEEEGLALESDGRFALTSVGMRQSSVVIATPDGERPISVEGYAWLDDVAHHGFPQPFSRDGSRLFFLRRRSPRGAPDQIERRAPDVPQTAGELWVADVVSGHAEPMLPGFEIRSYDISYDDQLLVAEGLDASGKPAVWLARVDRRTSPTSVPELEGADSVRFSPDGGLFFRRSEPNGNFIWYRSPGGEEVRRVLEAPVADFGGVSPDGRWLLAIPPLNHEGSQRTILELHAFPTGGGPAQVVCQLCSVQWTPGGQFVYLLFPLEGHTALMSLPRPAALPDLPEGGVTVDALSSLSNLVWRKDGLVFPGAGPKTYAYSRTIVQRNIFRVPLREKN